MIVKKLYATKKNKQCNKIEKIEERMEKQEVERRKNNIVIKGLDIRNQNEENIKDKV